MTAVTVWQAVTPEERAMSYRTRHQIFCSGGGGDDLEPCGALEPSQPHDEWDRPDTWLFCGTINGEYAVTGRCIPGPQMPTISIIDKLGFGAESVLPNRWARMGCRLLWRLHLPAVRLLRWYFRHDWCEPSRLGLGPMYRRTPTGREAALSLMGEIMTASVRQGHPRALLTMRPELYGLTKEFPYNLAPQSFRAGYASGPQQDGFIMLATINFHEIPVALQWFSPELYQLTFPRGADWVDWSKVRPYDELAAQIEANKQQYRQHLKTWRTDKASFSVIG